MVRSALFGLQSSADIGVCSQTGQTAGSEAWPEVDLACLLPASIHDRKRLCTYKSRILPGHSKEDGTR